MIIGSGAASQTISSQVREAGWSVAVIDDRPLGGTCQLRGCDPKKVLVSGTEAIDASRRMATHGVSGRIEIDWPRLMAFKRTFTDPVPARQAARYKEQGIAVFQGEGRFTSPETIQVNGHELKAAHAVIAAGAQPVRLGIPGEEHVATSDRFLELEALPARVVFIGGGYIAAEFSHIAARSGARVTVIQNGPRMLMGFDPDLVGWLMEAFKGLGIDVRTGSPVERVEKTAHGFLVHAGRERLYLLT